VGKSFFCLSFAKSFLQQFPKGLVVFFDSESSLDSDMVKNLKLEIKRFIHVPIKTIEEFRDKLNRMVNEEDGKENRTPLFFILDSLGFLSSLKETEDTDLGKNTLDMTKQKTIKSVFRVVGLNLAKAQFPLIVTSHVYESIGSYIPQKVLSGGQALQYISSSIVMLTKSNERDATTKEITGVNIRCKMEKSRLTKPGREVSVYLDFNKGLDRYSGLLELGESAGVFEKLDKKWRMPDGEYYFESKIYETPERFFTKDILDKIDVYCQREFKYQTPSIEVTPVVEETPKDEAEEIVEKKRRGRPPKEKD